MKRIILSAITVLIITAPITQAKWKPVEGKIMTRWAAQVDPEKPWPEYPRPQMVRADWRNLNGLWKYAITERSAAAPSEFAGQILVPFAVESALSGVGKTVGTDNCLWYQRTFTLPDDWAGKRILLNFEAVDWEATVWVNGTQVGSHQGGYDPFTCDITGALWPAGPQQLLVRVWDPTDDGYQPRGKQVNRPEGIWYTSVTGIWQTVWLEAVPQGCIESLKITPDVDKKQVKVEVNVSGINPKTHLADKYAIAVTAFEGDRKIAVASGICFSSPFTLKIPDARLWSPDDPHLYNLRVQLLKEGSTADQVESYFGLRKIELKKDEHGINRLFLNNQPLFQYGPLDQGWWPDGLYTPPTDEAMRYDLEVTKNIGMNMLRKHVKVEPRRLYYWADKLGLLIWQDMPSGDRGIRSDQPDIHRIAQSARTYDRELKAMIDNLHNHPSIVMWVPFNEGWGQFDTVRVTNWIKQYDPGRLVDDVSGWADRGVGDVMDMHSYPGPDMPPVEEGRAVVLGEFGGLGLPIKGHTWQDEKNWGYRSFENQDALTAAYLKLITDLRPLIGKGLAAAVYTQTTDVEIEVNGLLTYDRAVLKMEEDALLQAHKKLYLPPPIEKVILPDARQGKYDWKYTFEKPDGNWIALDYDDHTWKTGPAGFGRSQTPNSIVNTVWNTNHIWLRRTFELDSVPTDTILSIFHDEDAEVYINNTPAAAMDGYTTGYIRVPLFTVAENVLKKGKNIIALYCSQTVGGQYIDVGLIELVEQK